MPGHRPGPDGLPGGFGRDIAGVERFALLLLEAAGPVASAVKVNLAFFEAFGSRGLAALERVRAAVPSDLPVLLDAKRGDIGSTSEQHARALFDHLGADAVTASPYLGGDAIGPLLERADRFVYLLCRTSNPGAAELQDLRLTADPAAGAPEEPVSRRIARLATGWQRYPDTVGLVVGATAPAELAGVRTVAPALPFLVPGVGSQGGDATATLREGPARAGRAAGVPGGALLVNVSRGIAGAARHAPDAAEAVAAAAGTGSASLRVLGCARFTGIIP